MNNYKTENIAQIIIVNLMVKFLIVIIKPKMKNLTELKKSTRKQEKQFLDVIHSSLEKKKLLFGTNKFLNK